MIHKGKFGECVSPKRIFVCDVDSPKLFWVSPLHPNECLMQLCCAHMICHNLLQIPSRSTLRSKDIWETSFLIKKTHTYKTHKTFLKKNTSWNGVLFFIFLKKIWNWSYQAQVCPEVCQHFDEKCKKAGRIVPKGCSPWPPGPLSSWGKAPQITKKMCFEPKYGTGIARFEVQGEGHPSPATPRDLQGFWGDLFPPRVLRTLDPNIDFGIFQFWQSYRVFIYFFCVIYQFYQVRLQHREKSSKISFGLTYHACFCFFWRGSSRKTFEYGCCPNVSYKLSFWNVTMV